MAMPSLPQPAPSARRRNMALIEKHVVAVLIVRSPDVLESSREKGLRGGAQ